MKKYRIAFIPGDGIGPEVARETEKILNACAEGDMGGTSSTSEVGDTIVATLRA